MWGLGIVYGNGINVLKNEGCRNRGGNTQRRCELGKIHYSWNVLEWTLHEGKNQKSKDQLRGESSDIIYSSYNFFWGLFFKLFAVYFLFFPIVKWFHSGFCFHHFLHPFFFPYFFPSNWKHIVPYHSADCHLSSTVELIEDSKVRRCLRPTECFALFGQDCPGGGPSPPTANCGGDGPVSFKSTYYKLDFLYDCLSQFTDARFVVPACNPTGQFSPQYYQ